MENLKFTEGFLKSIEISPHLRAYLASSQVMILIEGPLDWGRLKKAIPDAKFIIAVTQQELLMGAETAGYRAFSIQDKVLYSEEEGITKKEMLQRAVHELALKHIVPSGSNLVILYSCFDPTIIDSISIVKLDEHQEKLDWQKLRKLDTNIPPKTIRMVVELAVSIGREGREGKKVGTMFVIGDTKKVMANSRSIGFDPVRGYTCKERDLSDKWVRGRNRPRRLPHDQLADGKGLPLQRIRHPPLGRRGGQQSDQRPGRRGQPDKRRGPALPERGQCPAH